MTSRSRALALASALVASSIASLCGQAWAQAPPTAASEAETASETAPAIVLLFEPDRPDSVRLARAIESHLAGLPVRVVLEPQARSDILTWLESGHMQASARHALGLLALDTGQSVWRLFFLDVDGAPTLIRRLRSSPEHAPLDEAGVAVRLLVEALLDARQLGTVAPVLRGDARSPATLPPRASPKQGSGSSSRGGPKAAERSRRPAGSEPNGASNQGASAAPRRQPFSLFLGPTGTTWLEKQPWQFGALVGVELELSPAWSLSLAYSWYPPLTYHLDDVALTLSRHPARAYAAYTLGAGFSPSFWLGVGADAVARETLRTGPDYRGTAERTTWSWGPVAGVGVVTPSWSRFRGRVDLGVEIPTRPIDYVVQTDTPTRLASTRSASPFLSICLSLRL